MNITSQYTINPKSRRVYSLSSAIYKKISYSSTRLRLGEERQFLNSKKNYKFFRVDGIDFKMIQCPKGSFIMGSDIKDDRNPKRIVSIEKPFLLGETEVTQELFEIVMGFNPSKHQGEGYPNSNKSPVEKVTWYDALIFCEKLSKKLGKKPYYNVSEITNEEDRFWKPPRIRPSVVGATVKIDPTADGFRLPFEKEWEYAAKARTNNKWAGTNELNKLGEVAWFNDNSSYQTQPVKGKSPNEWGFYDMSGNVREWCWDESKISVRIPRDRVDRGGCYADEKDGHTLRITAEYYCEPNERVHNLGFRIASNLII